MKAARPASNWRWAMPALAAANLFLALTGPGIAYCNKSGTYINSDGHTVKDPRCADDAAGAKYLCRDGSYSFSEHRQGACSRHGGVEKSLQ